jgi:hypothetical protein
LAGKVYSPGDLLPWRLRTKEDPMIVEWINMQDEVADAIRFCVEEEIRRNGLRNLARVIPSKRPPLEVGRGGDLPSISPVSLPQETVYKASTPSVPVQETVKIDTPLQPVQLKKEERESEAPTVHRRGIPPIPGVSGSKSKGSIVDDW